MYSGSAGDIKQCSTGAGLVFLNKAVDFLSLGAVILAHREVNIIVVFFGSGKHSSHLSMIENFCNMQNLLLLILAMQTSSDVHQATGIGHNQRWRLCCFEIADFSFQPLCRKLRMFHRKNSAETAALFSVGQFDNLRATD